MDDLEQAVTNLAAQTVDLAGKETHGSLLALLGENSDYAVRIEVAKNTYTPSDVIEALTEDEAEIVRWYAIQNPRLPLDTLKRIASDPEHEHWRAALMNQSVTFEILEELALSENQEVREAVRRRVVAGWPDGTQASYITALATL